MNIRRLGPGDEGVVANLATRPPQTALFGDERTLFLVAFDGERPMGFVLAHELPRRHGDPSNLLVYEVDVAEVYRRRGVGKALLDDLATLARRAGSERAGSSRTRTTTPRWRGTGPRAAFSRKR
jgi:GNAT superfamily N-acetyltransferase